MLGYRLPVLLSLWLDLTSGQIAIQLIPQHPVIQQSVTMNVVGINRKIFAIMWFKGINASAEHQILIYLPADPTPLFTEPLYVSRTRPFPNGSLQITDLQIIDSGNYTVRIQTERRVEQASVALTIYAPSIPGACVCSAGLRAGETAGIVCGTVLGIVLIVSATFLLYKRCVLPVREEQRDTSNKTEEPPREYYNVHAATVCQPANQEPVYMDLEYKSQDTYSDLQR